MGRKTTQETVKWNNEEVFFMVVKKSKRMRWLKRIALQMIMAGLLAGCGVSDSNNDNIFAPYTKGLIGTLYSWSVDVECLTH